MNPEMNLINQAFFYEQMQQVEKERMERQHRGHQNRSRRFPVLRESVGSMLVAMGRRLQTLDSAHAEQSA